MLWVYIEQFFNFVAFKFLYLVVPTSLSLRWYDKGFSKADGILQNAKHCEKHSTLSGFAKEPYTCEECKKLLRWRDTVRFHVGEAVQEA